MKYTFLIGLLLLLSGCGTTAVTLQLPKQETEKVEKDCQDEEDFAYANGLVMARRVLSEEKMLVEAGVQTEQRTCEQVADDLFEEGIPIANGTYKLNHE